MTPEAIVILAAVCPLAFVVCVGTYAVLSRKKGEKRDE